MKDFISLKHLAKEFGMPRSNARKYVLGLGIVPMKARTSDSRSQLSLVLAAEDADRVRATRRQEGFPVDGIATGAAVVKDSGFFYAIALVPELDPRRIKLGFADDVPSRLSQHRTASPTATVLGSWPCKRVWERAVMDWLTASGCRHILNEVFEFDEPPALVASAERMFASLPHPNYRVPPSAHSPFAPSLHLEGGAK